jgi:hypothetical protein
VQALCEEAAAIARSWGWTADDITARTVMTHAEAASNRDGRIMHDNYGPMIWGGTGERWDLLQLEKNGTADGGDQLRARIRAILAPTDGAPPATQPGQPSGLQLQFRGSTMIQARGEALMVQSDVYGTSWALVSDLLARYGIAYAWDANGRRVLIGALDVAPTYRDDSVQASVGWPLFTMTLETASAPVILTGIVRPSDAGDRAWCRVVEFAEEFGITVRFEPLELDERRGG